MTLNEQRQVQAKQNDLRSMIMKNTEMLAMALPKTITPERMARIAMTAITRMPKLGTCNPQSFFGALLTAAQLGLEVNTPLGQAYLIPYNSKMGMQCQFQLGYQGILDLAYRSGKYKRIKAVVVHEGDEFNYSYGLNATLNHVPKTSGQPTHVYALYELINGGVDFEVWTYDQAMQHGAKYSKSFGDSPWQTNPEEMAKKTVLRSLLKYAPKSVELAESVQSDEGLIEKKLVQSGSTYELITNVSYGDEVLGVPEQMQEPSKNQNPTKQNVQKTAPVQKTEIPESEELDAIWEDRQQAIYDSGPEFPM